jgi:hypothetical protein
MPWLPSPIPNPNKLLPVVSVDVGGEGRRGSRVRRIWPCVASVRQNGEDRGGGGGERELPRMVDMPRDGACLNTATQDMTCTAAAERDAGARLKSLSCSTVLGRQLPRARIPAPIRG